MLYRIGLAFNAMISDGFYNFSTGDVDTLPWFSDQNRNTVLEYVQRDYTLTGNDAFIEAWKANIIDNNRIYTDANGAPMSISGVEDLRNKVTQTGGFYIFTHIPESNSSKYGLKIYAKRKVQMAQRSLDHQYIGSQVSPAEIDNLHYKGCAETFGALPEDVISGNANINGIGEPIAAIVSIIVAVTGIITAIATLIRAKNGALTKEELNSAVISEADFAMFGSSSGGGTGGSGSGTNYQQAGFGGSSWLLPVLGIGALGLIFMKGKKSKKKSKGK
jgi:hypothetical protein